mmetsp:Transcript_20607/g.52590  ORF Transcript_20607/g.52590 Transcript_20607/m.52590 type:complete len:210 (-) Transcript_20607:38-667(-)
MPATMGTRTTCTHVSSPSQLSNTPSGVPGKIWPPKERTISFSDHVRRTSTPPIEYCRGPSSGSEWGRSGDLCNPEDGYPPSNSKQPSSRCLSNMQAPPCGSRHQQSSLLQRQTQHGQSQAVPQQPAPEHTLPAKAAETAAAAPAAAAVPAAQAAAQEVFAPQQLRPVPVAPPSTQSSQVLPPAATAAPLHVAMAAARLRSVLAMGESGG